MVIEEERLNNLDRRYRANLINSLSGIKPANLIGTRSNKNQDNLALFSSVVHLGSQPAQIGIIMRPQIPEIKDTYANILETGYYTINSVEQPFIKKAHYTSARLKKDVSEFDVMKLKRAFINDFHAPFVSESHIKIGLRYIDRIELPNGCIFIIGEVALIELPDIMISEEGHLDLSSKKVVGISGLNSYYSLDKIASFPYAKHNEIPDFNT